MDRTVYCICKDMQQANRIVNQLLHSNINKNDISLLLPNKEQERQFNAQQQSLSQSQQAACSKEGMESCCGGEKWKSESDTKGNTMGHEINTKTPEGATAGGLAGGIIGGTLGLLAGMGTLAIPGLGPFIAAGPIMGALAGSGIGGATGLLIGALTGMGIPEIEAKQLADKLKNQANILLSVYAHSAQEVDAIKNIFQQNGAENISTTMEIASK